MSALHPGVPDLSVVRRVLELRAGETLALSVLFTRGADARAFHLPTQLDDAVAWVERQAAADRTISVGVAALSAAGAERLDAARAHNRRARPRATDHRGYAWLAADLDPDEDETLTDLRARVEAFSLRPTLLASSGRGLHAWYRLTAPVDVAAGRAAAEDLARALRGDPGAANVDRALRLPGTWNPKPAAACLATVLAHADVSHSLEDLTAAAQAIAPPPAPPAPPRTAPPAPGQPGLDVAAALREERDLAAALDELSGPARNGAWQCPSGHDTGPSLHLLRDDPHRWICEGAGHPEQLGRRTPSGRFSGDVVDLLAWQAQRTLQQYLSDERTHRLPASTTGYQHREGVARSSSTDTPPPAAAPDAGSGARGTSSGGEGRPSAADRALAVALEHFDLGWNATDGAYAIPKSGPRIVRMLRGSSQSLRAELGNLFAKREGRTPSAGALADALNVLDGRAREAPPKPLGLRIAQHTHPERGPQLVLDLGDSEGHAVVIDSRGWTVTTAAPVLFRRTPLTYALPMPERGGKLEELRELLNVTDESWLLVRGMLVAAYLPDVPHPIALLAGEHGTGKTTAARLLVQLLDPSPAPLRSSPHKEDDWGTTANGSYVVGIDNVSTIPAWLSDAWCRAVTGDGYVRRQLYTDSDLTVIALRRQIVLTGIDPSGLRGDLADRLLRVELQVIPPERRLTDRVLAERWAAAHPRILGALLDLIVRTLEVLPAARESLTSRPRMADFAEVLAAVDMVTKDNALGAFLGLGEQLARSVVEGDPFGAALFELLDRQAYGFAGSARQLLEAVEEHAHRPLPTTWPGTPEAVGHALKRLTPALRACDVEITQSKVQGKRQWTLRRPAALWGGTES